MLTEEKQTELQNITSPVHVITNENLIVKWELSDPGDMFDLTRLSTLYHFQNVISKMLESGSILELKNFLDDAHNVEKYIELCLSHTSWSITEGRNNDLLFSFTSLGQTDEPWSMYLTFKRKSN
jgi:hypothetical protein